MAYSTQDQFRSLLLGAMMKVVGPLGSALHVAPYNEVLYAV